MLTFVVLLAFRATDGMASALLIKSQPSESEVFVKSLKGDKANRIGKTPFEMPVSQIASSYVQSEVFVIEVRKEGFETKSFVITKASADIDLFVTLDVSSDLALMRDFDSLIAGLFEAQREIRSEQYDAAERRLGALREKFPRVSAIPEFLGSIRFLKKDFNGALDIYRGAVALNPQNVDAFRMKALLESRLGIAKPEGAGASPGRAPAESGKP